MILAGKAAEPVLVASVLYASVKLLPIVHFPPQCDVIVFVAQFIALDIGGLSLNKLADQAKKDGNEEGAKHARRLSIALVGTVIDTILLIARAVMAVLYSRVIHSLKEDDEPEPPSVENIEEMVAEKMNAALQASLAALRHEIVAHLEVSLSQYLDGCLTELDMKQDAAMAHLFERGAGHTDHRDSHKRG